MNVDRFTQDDESLILVNVLEELVRDRVDSYIKAMDMCKCEKCRLNACAIALNSLPAKYVTTTRGALMAQLAATNLEYQTSVQVQVLKALNVVKENPIH